MPDPNTQPTQAHAAAMVPLDAPSPWSPPRLLAGHFDTQRLRLRFWQLEDAAGMLAAIDVDRASFLPWLLWVRTDNRTETECAGVIDRMRQRRERTEPLADDFTIGIFDRLTGDVVGGTGLHRVNHGAHEAEIGYWIRPDRRRQGVCTEAVAGLLTWSFGDQGDGGWGLRRIHIRCAGSNESSQRVPRKLRLREEARLVQERWTEGFGWDDTLVWGVCRDEWRVRTPT